MLLVHEVKPSLGLAFGSEQRIINVECTPDASWIWGHVGSVTPLRASDGLDQKPVFGSLQ